jgi:peptide/nickel transport system substrate-binding protein
VPEGAERLSWDLEGAQQLLQDAGYIDTDEDGVREMPAGSLEPGRPLDFRYDVRTTDQPSIDASAFVSEWLRQIGIETEVTAVTSARLGDLISQGDYDLFSWGWTTTVDPDTALSWFQCSQRSLNPNSLGNNDAYYCNPEYDRLYLEQQQTLNKDARWDIVHEMQRIYYEDSAYAVLWYDPYFQAYRADRFTGYNPQPPPNGDLLEGFGGVSTVWLTLRPISSGAAEGGNSGEAKGIPAVAWATIAIVAIAAAVFIVRRRRAGDSDDKA